MDNLDVINAGFDRVVLRPLIGLDKVEIERLARDIGTLEISIRPHPPCPYAPKHPVTKASRDKLRKIEEKLGSF